MKNRIPHVILGLGLIALGIGFLGNVLNLWRFELFFDGWWTLFIIIPCIYSIFSQGFDFGNIFGLSVGILLLLAAQDIITFAMILKIIVPAALIILGIRILFFNGTHAVPESIPKIQTTYQSFFSGNDIIYPHEPFTGARCHSIFGGIKLDLRNAIIESDQVIVCNAIFGGIDIYLPQNLRVAIDCIPVFGGVENKYFMQGDENSPKIYIKATCLFGGVSVQ